MDERASMPNIKSAKKRASQDEKRRVRNIARKSAIKPLQKKFLSLLKVQTLLKQQNCSKMLMHNLLAQKAKGYCIEIPLPVK